MCKWRGVRICCHESPHGEAVSSRLRLFHTVSKEEFSEVRGSNLPRRAPPLYQAGRGRALLVLPHAPDCYVWCEDLIQAVTTRYGLDFREFLQRSLYSWGRLAVVILGNSPGGSAACSPTCLLIFFIASSIHFFSL